MPTPVSPVRWAILSTGRIAGTFACGVKESRTGRLVAVGSRAAESAARFAGQHGIDAARAHGSYEALLADSEVEAVYIATPHPEHVEWAVKAAEAGKHVFSRLIAGAAAGAPSVAPVDVVGAGNYIRRAASTSTRRRPCVSRTASWPRWRSRSGWRSTTPRASSAPRAGSRCRIPGS